MLLLLLYCSTTQLSLTLLVPPGFLSPQAKSNSSCSPGTPVNIALVSPFQLEFVVVYLFVLVSTKFKSSPASFLSSSHFIHSSLPTLQLPARFYLTFSLMYCWISFLDFLLGYSSPTSGGLSPTTESRCLRNTDSD